MYVKVPALDRLVVGVDDSPTNAAVLAWASREAAVRQCSLQVVATSGNNLDELFEAASDATLLIVGTELLAGDARRGSCPVVVVRGQPRETVRRIVVGVDSSNAAAAALDWAITQASRHAAVVVVVHAWQQPDDDDRSLRARDLRRADAQCIANLAADLYESGPIERIQRRAMPGPAADILISESTNADLLVVGSRGSSGYRTLQFGSVAMSALDGADCPVVVVHPRLSTSGTGDPGVVGRP